MGNVSANDLAIPPVSAVELRCEYRVDPLGIDVCKPRLSWTLQSARRGERQTAYELRVSSSAARLAAGNADLWNTGKVASSATNQIVYSGEPLVSRMRCHWMVRVWDADDEASPWSLPALWSMGLLADDDWQADWIGLNEPNSESAPDANPFAVAGLSHLATPRYLRKACVVNGPIQRATVYVTALGLYELHLNGSRVGDHLLAPEWTNYHRRVQYQTFDVTNHLRQGDNAMGALLGNGWYCGDWQFWRDRLRPIYGDQPYFRAQLEIQFTDGTRQTVSTNESWRGTTDGPLRFSGIYEGETYDARRAMPGWDRVGFNDEKAWRAAVIATPQARPLVWQRSEPIRGSEEVRPVAITEPQPGIYVFDLGQNIAGWCRLNVNEPAGRELTLKFNEMLNPDGTVYMDNLHAGHLSTGDRQIIRYISGGTPEIYEPHFTYQGFRYVEVHGLSAPPTQEFLAGRVFHTDMARTGDFACSNPLLNRLFQNIQWSQRANIMGVPTDCCQRDERCGYTGDMNFFMPTAVYNFDMAAFFHKWLVDLCQDSQLPDGHFADHAPTYGPGDGWNVGWSDAGVICPYLIYRTYGDTRVIRDHYGAMKRSLQLQINTARDDLRGPDHVGNGDWLNLGGGASNRVIGTAYYAYNLRLMSEMAGAIGETADEKEYADRADRVAGAFATNLVDEEGRIRDTSQTGYALAFTMGLVPLDKREAMVARFAEEMALFDGHLATGFIGTPRLLPALHLAGRDDLAHRVLLYETFPSWLYPVTLGATTVWERWDGWTPEAGFADPGMNSFNHYAFGSVGEYLFGVIGGIQAEAPGYAVIRVQPVLGEGITWAKVNYRSIQGLIACHWARDGKRLTMEVTIPANTTATVHVPAEDPANVRESGRPARSSEGVRFLGGQPGAAVLAVVAGTYRFESEVA